MYFLIKSKYKKYLNIVLKSILNMFKLIII